ncbi:MAG: CDP-glycerol glycerophosphotransferase family protein [Microbacterium sp.]|uniref:CDP-glycerol glycerophosphotransferase family protein n=1 Tax=Microbacterium sp. TaxID=51671 RepID=UPI001ACF69B5|nr:CDP-glycerol glycerophosphotransferase family protein [Microbacterium sp.]MBN9176030.1 CDP-glycerol glycerophosphotransferase family protein [Microbacterium sp.]
MTITARIDDTAVPTLVLAGTGPRPAHARLVGRRAQVDARLTGRGTTWTARLPLEAARWSRAPLPLPSGAYAVEVVDAGGDRVEIDAMIADTMTATMRVALADGTLRVRPPIDPAYESGEGQDALERRYAMRPQGLENAVFFESFYGRNASCNPRAIDREIARVAPGVTRYWSVVDLSVEVPDGAVPVVEGSPQWWRARGSARLLVVNDWLRRRYARRRGQVVLQTWHGTALKRLALHRPGFDPRRMAAVIRESRRWDVLLAQNSYGERILRKAYAFRGRPVWVEGYPRNDALVSGSSGAVRAGLGIARDERVILYAPTWRDDRDEIVDHLDLERLAAETGAVVLVRGHSRTLVPGSDIRGSRVVDVTAYPDVSDLLLAADALVTDYSSVMFDFTATGKPIFFFTPDLEHYREDLRGFYFDLAAHAPGPLSTTQAQLTDALVAGGLAEVPAGYADRYRRWRERFNARDDGHAAERVVARILDQGYIDRA